MPEVMRSMPARNWATRSSASSPSRPCVSRSTPAPPCPPPRRERGGAARHSGRPGCCRHIRGFPGGRVLVQRVAFPSAPLERAARPCQPEPPGRTVEGGGDAVLWTSARRSGVGVKSVRGITLTQIVNIFRWDAMRAYALALGESAAILGRLRSVSVSKRKVCMQISRLVRSLPRLLVQGASATST